VQDGENIILSIISISKTFSLSTYKILCRREDHLKEKRILATRAFMVSRGWRRRPYPLHHHILYSSISSATPYVLQHHYVY
jgi:hypothetical protein